MYEANLDFSIENLCNFFRFFINADREQREGITETTVISSQFPVM